MKRKTTPVAARPAREPCPVCGEVSYSAAGIHPQCAVQQADAKRMKRAKSSSPKPDKTIATAEGKPWHKNCPKCKALVHVRKKNNRERERR